MNINKTIITALIPTVLLLSVNSVKAQTEPNNLNNLPEETNQINTSDPLEDISPSDLNKARNWARMAAEQANGGLGSYRAEESMYGPAYEAPYEYKGNGDFVFTFKGKSPGEEDYKIQSVVTVNIITNTVTVNSNTSLVSQNNQ